MTKQFLHSFIFCTIAIGSSLLVPLVAPSAFRAESFEACFQDPSLKSKRSNQKATILVSAHKNLPASSINILWVDFNGKWKIHKILRVNSSFALQTYVGHQFVARMGESCEYFSANQPFNVLTIGEFVD